MLTTFWDALIASALGTTCSPPHPSPGALSSSSSSSLPNSLVALISHSPSHAMDLVTDHGPSTYGENVLWDIVIRLQSSCIT